MSEQPQPAGTPGTECPVADCRSGPCRTPAPFILADTSEVPLACPNRVDLRDPAVELTRLLANDDIRITPQAAMMLAEFPTGGTHVLRRRLLEAGRLTLLEARSRQPIRRGGGRTRTIPPAPPPAPPQPPPERLSWIEYELLDVDGRPMAGEKYRVELTNGQVKEGVLDARGHIRFEELPPGDCRISFPRLDVVQRQTEA